MPFKTTSGIIAEETRNEERAAQHPPMHNFYFTFGCGIEQPHRNKFVKISARSPERAREIMFNTFGPEWAVTYDEASFAGQQERYGITQLIHIQEAL